MADLESFTTFKEKKPSTEGKTLVCPLMDTLDIEFIETIKALTQPDKKLTVVIAKTHDQSSSIATHQLEQIEGVGAVVTAEEDLKDNFLFHFSSQIHFYNQMIVRQIRRRLQRVFSPHFQQTHEVNIDDEKFIPPTALVDQIKAYQAEGKKVVIVAGVLDVVHSAHIDFFVQAKKHGDVLIVLTNSDFSATNQPKNVGQDRPINQLRDRVKVLSAIKPINKISAFDGETILPILDQLDSITYVKSAKDTSAGVKREIELVESHHGCAIILPTKKFHSTKEEISSTAIIRSKRNASIITSGDSVDRSEFVGRLRELVLENFGVKFENISPVFDSIVDQAIERLFKLNSQTGILTSWEEYYLKSFAFNLESRSRVEVEMVKVIFSLLLPEFKNSNPVYSSLILSMALDMVGLDAEVYPVQYPENDSLFGTIVGAKLADGQMLFIDPMRKKIHEPIDFDQYYHKHLPQHTSFQIREGLKSTIARRLYFETPLQRKAALAMNVIFEIFGNNSKSDHEIELLFKKVFRDFAIDQEVGGEGHSESSLPPAVSPKIIAHGGITTLNLPFVWAENSSEAIVKAIEAKVDVLEFDVVPTKDGGWIVSHFVDLSKITTGVGQTTDLNMAVIEQIKFKDKDGHPLAATLISLSEALSIVGQSAIPIKIDIKVKDIVLTDLAALNQAIIDSGIPLEKVIVTCGDAEITKAIHQLNPDIPLELNTVEATNFLLANGLMKNPKMAKLFLHYINDSARKVNAKDVSLMQVAMNTWGKEVFEYLVTGIHKFGREVQVWIASNVDEFLLDKDLGVDFVLMHDPKLIADCMALQQD